MSRWYEGIDPVTVLIRCGDAVHRLTWRRGKLVLEDHHLTAERTVQAMGGEPCPCAVVLEAWSMRWLATRQLVKLLSLVDDAEAVAASSIPPVATGDRCDAIYALPPSPAEDDPRVFAARRPPGSDPRIVEMWRRLRHENYIRQVAIGLPAPLLSRCLLGAVMGVERRWSTSPADERIEVEKLLLRRARRYAVHSMRSWRRLDGVSLSVESSLVDRNEKRELSGYVDSRRGEVSLLLPVSWFVTVWARGRAVVDGCFVLDATDGPDGVEATVVRWERITAAASEAVTARAKLWRTGEGVWRLRLL